MSLAELTRNCFQAGIPTDKWIALTKLFVSKNHHLGDAENALSDSVLILFKSYPKDISLGNYLKHAIQCGILSVSVFVATFLQAARSPELHNSATLDMLCRIALDAHYSSGLPPIGSVVSYSESPIVLLGTIQDALALLRTAHSLPISHSHQLTTSASELVILLLSCVADISQVSTAQALVHFADASDMLQTIRLTPDVRQGLETFVLSLSLLIGDDAKVAREAQMMHTIQMALGKGELLGPNSETDIVTCSLLLHNLVMFRGGEFGAGDESKPVAMLIATLRWTSWAPNVFYSQLLLSAFISVSHCASSDAMLWRAFIIGRLPNLLTLFERAVKLDSTIDADWRAALQLALTFVLRQSDLVGRCEHVFSQPSRGSDAMQEDHESFRSFSRDLLQQLLANGLIDQAFAVSIDPLISNDSAPKLQTEAHDIGHDLESYLDSKLSPDTSLEDARTSLQRVWRDAGSHPTFADVVRKRFTNLTNNLEVEALSHLCKILYSFEEALDIVSFHVRIMDLIFHALGFLDEYDCETVGDPQTAVTHLGDVVLFVQSTLSRYHLERRNFSLENKIRSSDLLRYTSAVHSADTLSGDDSTAFAVWFKALFDSSSEGIEDTILRSTQPKTLLHIAATLFSHAISASSDKKIDGEVLTNGVSYFLGPLLNWTLVGVIKALLREIQLKGFNTPVHWDILQTLILSPSCPQPVLRLCGPNVLRVLAEGKKAGLSEGAKFNMAGVQKIAFQSLHMTDGDGYSVASKQPWQDQSQQALRNTLAMARAGWAPCLDVSRCILVTPPSKFLQCLWTELCVAASMGETETCTRLATFVLTTPRSSSPPLLPLFLHNVLPSIIANIDHQQPHEQSMSVELLVAIISSVLTAALHLEWALRSVCNEERHVLGQASAAMARRLAGDLRGRKNSPTGHSIAQRLASSQSFTANFPGSMGELGI